MNWVRTECEQDPHLRKNIFKHTLRQTEISNDFGWFLTHFVVICTFCGSQSCFSLVAFMKHFSMQSHLSNLDILWCKDIGCMLHSQTTLFFNKTFLNEKKMFINSHNTFFPQVTFDTNPMLPGTINTFRLNIKVFLFHASCYRGYVVLIW